MLDFLTIYAVCVTFCLMVGLMMLSSKVNRIIDALEQHDKDLDQLEADIYTAWDAIEVINPRAFQMSRKPSHSPVHYGEAPDAA